MNNFYFFNNFYHWALYKIDKTRIWAYSENNHYTKEIVVNKKFLNSLNNIFKKSIKSNRFMQFKNIEKTTYRFIR